MATSHVGLDFPGGLSLLQAVDLPPAAFDVDPAAQHYSLHTAHNATFTLIPAGNVWEATRQYRQVNGLQAAGGVSRLAGRFVFDLWGGRYGPSGDELTRAFRYGLTDAAVVWHNWQRWGYDYRLPEIYPPHPELGTADELARLGTICRKAKVLFALHDNYIDFYPDAEGFSYEQNIAFHADGKPVQAWLNEGRGARSYRFRADRIEPFLQANLRALRDPLQPSAYFIDVWSSADPYDYWTADGKFFDRVFTRDVWRKQFAWIRDWLGDQAPQISESGHDQLIGWLDGAQTNHLRVGPSPGGRMGWCVWDIRCDSAERTPWFDAAHHDRFILHGAGYPGRYEGGLEPRTHGIYSDDYLATEMLTGHPAMVSQPFGHDVVRKYWLTHDVLRALALRTIEDVSFADGDLHRQHVRWSGDAEIWVNRGESDWEIAGQTLPAYGFLARVPTEQGLVTAAISRRQDLIVETAAASECLYFNGRQLASGPRQIRPVLVSAQPVGARQLDLAIQWLADEAIPDGYQPFLHFIDAAGEIAFQAGYDGQPLEAQRTGRSSISAKAYVPDRHQPGETFELRVGMYQPKGGGPRLALLGDDDGDHRIRLGKVELVGADGRVTSLRWSPAEAKSDPFLARQNPAAKAVDFGPVVTAGGCRLGREGATLVLTPLPRDHSAKTVFQVRWEQLPWKLPRPTHGEMLAEDGRVLRRQPVGDAVILEVDRSVFACRLVNDARK